jgi:hypothetical protein
MGGDLGRMSEQCDEVLERILGMQFGGVDQRHVDVADPRAALAAIEQRVVAMANGHLERSLTNVVLEGRARYAKEQGQLVPALEQVLERIAEAGVGLDAFVIELSDDPLLELGHHRRAVALMNSETLVVGQRSLAALLVGLEHVAEGLEHVLTLGREVRGLIDDVAATVSIMKSTG